MKSPKPDLSIFSASLVAHLLKSRLLIPVLSKLHSPTSIVVLRSSLLLAGSAQMSPERVVLCEDKLEGVSRVPDPPGSLDLCEVREGCPLRSRG